MERLERDLSRTQLTCSHMLLGWLVKSKRPLKWSEIQIAFSINLESEHNELNPDRRICDSVEDLCGTLVQILPGDRIELVHSTARMYTSIPVPSPTLLRHL